MSCGPTPAARGEVGGSSCPAELGPGLVQELLQLRKGGSREPELPAPSPDAANAELCAAARAGPMGEGSVTCCLHRLGTSDTWPCSLLPAEGELRDPELPSPLFCPWGAAPAELRRQMLAAGQELQGEHGHPTGSSPRLPERGLCCGKQPHLPGLGAGLHSWHSFWGLLISASGRWGSVRAQSVFSGHS